VALAGISLLPLRILPAAARLLDGLSARGRRLAGALAGWQISRRAVREGSPVLLVVLAVATGTLVLAQHQSWRQSQLDQAAFATGADVTVGLITPLPLSRSGAIAQGRGVRTAMPAAVVNSGFDVVALDATKAARTMLLRPDLARLPPAALWRRITPARAGPGAPGPGLALPGRPARVEVGARVRSPAGQPGALSASLSVQDGSGIVYSVPAGTLPADGREHQLVAGLSGTGDRRAAAAPGYPLRLLGLSLTYQLPRFPPAPYPSAAVQRAAERAERRAAATPVTLDIGAVAVSGHASGSFPAAFAAARRLRRWHAAVSAAAFADPRVTQGTQPAIASWRVTPAGGTLASGRGRGTSSSARGSRCSR